MKSYLLLLAWMVNHAFGNAWAQTDSVADSLTKKAIFSVGLDYSMVSYSHTLPLLKIQKEQIQLG
jgi:hypothetical protein